MVRSTGLYGNPSVNARFIWSGAGQARLEDRELTGHDLIKTAVGIVLLSRTVKDQIDLIRAWAFERAVRASPRAGK